MPQTAATLRPATTSDAPAVAAVAAELGYPDAGEGLARRILDLARRDDHALMVAELDGRVVAWIHTCVIRSPLWDAIAEIHALVVTEAERSRGVGAALVAWAEEWARGQGCCRIRVRSRDTRLRAHRFYERLAYDVTKSQKVFDKRL